MKKFRPVIIQIFKIFLALYVLGVALSYSKIIPVDPMFFHFALFVVLLPIGLVGAAALFLIVSAIVLLILREVLKKLIINRLLVISGIWFIYIESTNSDLNLVAEINLLEPIKSKTRTISKNISLAQIHWRILYSILGTPPHPYLVDLKNKRTVYLKTHLSNFNLGKPAKLLKLKWILMRRA